MIILLEFLRYALVLIFGVALAFLFSGVENTRSNKLAIIVFCMLMLFIQMLSWQMLGLRFTAQLYPFITHLPLMLFFILYFKLPWQISMSSVLAPYLCCQIPRWIGAVMEAATGNHLVNHVFYIITMGVVYYFLKKYVVKSVQELMARSMGSCLLFGAVPLLYYLFDYATTVYTDLLYSGFRGAVQFTPSLICTFYFVFVLLYYNESQKQAEAQRQRDIFAAQLQQAQLDLNTMRQMESSTLIYRHDMRHHLSLIGSFAADGDMQKIKEYLASTDADIDALTPMRYCENETVNLILSTFETRAKKEGVALYAEVKLPEALGISDTELCALLSNALENAVAAAAQVTEERLRKVYVRALVNGGKLMISAENAYVGKIELEGELPKSKNPETGHGFGIKSIVSIVERHGGLYSFETEDGVFVLQLLLPLAS